MGKQRVVSDVIWLDQIEADRPLHDRLKAMPLGSTIELDVGGVAGRWERILDDRDSGTAAGVRAVVPRGLDGQRVEVEIPRETYLATFEERLLRWDIPESRIR